MKFKGVYILILLFWINGTNTNAQEVIKSEYKSIYLDNTPDLIIKSVTLKDENNNQEVDAGVL